VRWQELPTAVLVAKLRRGRAVLRWEAAKALSGKRGCVPQLLREVGKEQDDAVRQMLLYAIAHSHDERALDTLSRLLADRGETPDIRGQCAEGLAYILLPMDRRRSGYKAAIRTLMDALDDPSPIVRFWSIFALGSAGARPALPKLRALARSDRARVEGWWRVKDEAADAIEALETGNWPDRERRPAE
jgi:HEAT repeat protein